MELPPADQLLMRVGAAKTDVGRAFGFVKIHLPTAGQQATRETFTFKLDKAKLKEAELRDGHCLLRTNLVAEEPDAPGLTPRAVLEKLAAIQMLDVSFPTTDGRRLVMPRYTEPDPEQALLLLSSSSSCRNNRLRASLRLPRQLLSPTSM